MQLNKKNRIVINTCVFNRAMETATHIFFVNFDTKEDDASVIMFDRKMKLINNLFGGTAFIDILETGEYSWISKRIVNNINDHNDMVDVGIKLNDEKIKLK